MGTLTPVLGLPVPSAGDANNVPGDLLALANAIDGGSIIKRLSQAQIDALTTAQKPAGLVVYNQTAGQLQISNGASFLSILASVPRILAGTIVSNTATATLTFPAGFFTAPPIVTACNGDSAHNGDAIVAVLGPSVTVTSATLQVVDNWSSNNWRGNWIAMQP